MLQHMGLVEGVLDGVTEQRVWALAGHKKGHFLGAGVRAYVCETSDPKWIVKVVREYPFDDDDDLSRPNPQLYWCEQVMASGLMGINPFLPVIRSIKTVEVLQWPEDTTFIVERREAAKAQNREDNYDCYFRPEHRLCYFIEQERLTHFKFHTYQNSAAQRWLKRHIGGAMNLSTMEWYSTLSPDRLKEFKRDFSPKTRDHFAEALELVSLAREAIGAEMDLHAYNVMARKQGRGFQLVITDPFN